MRNGAWIVPRIFGHQATESRLNQRWRRLIPAWLQSYLLRTSLEALNDTTALGVHSTRPPATTHIMLNNGISDKILYGSVRVRSGIKRFEGSKVVFKDGSVLDVDSVVFATGYSPKFQFFKPELISGWWSAFNEQILLPGRKISFVKILSVFIQINDERKHWNWATPLHELPRTAKPKQWCSFSNQDYVLHTYKPYFLRCQFFLSEHDFPSKYIRFSLNGSWPISVNECYSLNRAKFSTEQKIVFTLTSLASCEFCRVVISGNKSRWLLHTS